MKTPHKHAEIIKAWADGAEIEYRHEYTIGWCSCAETPEWNDDVEYRVKPEPKPDVVLHGVAVSDGINHRVWTLCPHNGNPSNNLKLTFDGTTNKLIKAEVI